MKARLRGRPFRSLAFRPQRPELVKLALASTVQGRCGQPHRLDADHRCLRFNHWHSHSPHSLAPAMGQFTVTVAAPRRSSTRMSGSDDVAAISGGDAAGNASGKSSPTAVAAPGAAEGTCVRRHLCTRLAFRPCVNATAATDATGSWHAANTALLSSSLCRRRRSVLSIGVHLIEVDTILATWATGINVCSLPAYRGAVARNVYCCLAGSSRLRMSYRQSQRPPAAGRTIKRFAASVVRPNS